VNFKHVEEIADAVLYEGYMLYPYRPSSVKNRQRFNFGVLCPPAYCQMYPGSELPFMQTECLFKAAPSTRLTVTARFLQLIERSITKRNLPNAPTQDSATELEHADRLEAAGGVNRSWQEATERSITHDDLRPAELLAPRILEFTIPGDASCEDPSEEDCAGVVLRESRSLAGSLHLRTERCRDDVMKLAVRLENGSSFQAAGPDTHRDAALAYSLVSAHLILGIENGEFLSLLDPPAEHAELARNCSNVGNWPVLAGDDATAMLASRIILYDYPKIAPESAGSLFDGTEIDEILSLRILTLTDQEKAEIRRSDDRARELLDRTESIPDEQFMKLHGVLRGLPVGKEGAA
jgi:hypothetical protein